MTTAWIYQWYKPNRCLKMTKMHKTDKTTEQKDENTTRLHSFYINLHAVSGGLAAVKTDSIRAPNHKSQINMKQSRFLIFFLFTLLPACASFRSVYSSRFVDIPPQLGMTKADFVAIYGNPFRQNVFYDEYKVYCEELIYREEINHGGSIFQVGEMRALNSIFLFKNEKLESQFQEDDEEYQFQLQRARERQLIRERIDAEKERTAAEKERLEIEKKKAKEKE